MKDKLQSQKYHQRSFSLMYKTEHLEYSAKCMKIENDAKRREK